MIADLKTLILNLALLLMLFATMTFDARFLIILLIEFTACAVVMFGSVRLRSFSGPCLLPDGRVQGRHAGLRDICSIPIHYKKMLYLVNHPSNN